MKKTLKYIFHIDHLLITIFSFVLLGLGYAAVKVIPLFNPNSEATSDKSMTDYFYALSNKYSDLNQEITIVNVKDEATNRGKMARVIAKIDSLKPWAIGVDIVFKGLRDSPEDNEALIETAMNVGDNVVWATDLDDYDIDKKSFAGKESSFFADALGVKEGFSNLDNDLSPDMIRNMLTVEGLGDSMMSSLPVAIAQVLDSADFEPHGKFTIDFTPFFRIVDCDSIDNNKDFIKDHIVLVGSTTSSSDSWNTPLGKMPGVVLQAYSLYTIRGHSNLRHANSFVSLLIAFVLCYIFELILDMGYQRLRRSNNSWSNFLLKSRLLLRVATFVFLALVTWGILALFIHCSWYVNAILILLLLGLLIESRRIYIAAIESLSKNHNWCILKNSLFNTDKK